jgi:hypothetical protein
MADKRSFIILSILSALADKMQNPRLAQPRILQSIRGKEKNEKEEK